MYNPNAWKLYMHFKFRPKYFLSLSNASKRNHLHKITKYTKIPKTSIFVVKKLSRKDYLLKRQNLLMWPIVRSLLFLWLTKDKMHGSSIKADCISNAQHTL